MQILKQVEEALAQEKGRRVVHDFLGKLAGEMEKLCAREQTMRKEIIDELNDSLGEKVPEIIFDSDGPEGLGDRLVKIGMTGAAKGSLPEQAIDIWERSSPGLFSIIRKKKATDALINRIVERLYEISGIGD